MRMKDKCGIVTAAGSGMGRAGSVRFAREGAAVAVVDIDADAVRAVVGEIESAGGRAVGIPAELTRDEDNRRIVREAANALDGIDFVWNHVGHPGPASVEGIEMEDFDTAVALNLRTVLVTTDAAIPDEVGADAAFLSFPPAGLCRGKPLDLAQFDRVSGNIEVVHPLQIEPELGRHSESSTNTQGGVRRHGPAAVDDFVDAPRRHTDRLRQTVLADSELFEKFRQMFSRVDRGDSVVVHNVLTNLDIC